MSKAEFLMLAHEYNPDKHRIGGWFASEKLDGIRMMWDGGVTRGLVCSEVPWANTAKHARFRTPPIATGLWTRYGQPVGAPAWWLDKLPGFCLDGEGWCERGNWQQASSIIKSTVNGCADDWKKVRYAIFDTPSIYDLFQDRDINNPNMSKALHGCLEWVIERVERAEYMLDLTEDFLHPSGYFSETHKMAHGLNVAPCLLVEQTKLPFDEKLARATIDGLLAAVEAKGGEGLILRSASSTWVPERTWNLLKVKRRQDMEGTVVGYKWGKETALGSRLLGKMGAATVRLDSGIIFDIGSGFTDDQRRMTWADGSGPANLEGETCSGEEASVAVHNPYLPRGSRVTFKYRELSDTGTPKEATFFRPFSA